jgi:hypothetical protein
MFPATLRRNRRRRPFHQLEQRLLHAFARHVARDRGVLRLARDLVDLVDIDDPALRPLDVVVRRLKQLEDDILDILADVTRFGQRRRIGHRERHVEDAGERLREQSLAATGRADEQNVRLGQLDIGTLGAVVEPLVVIVHRHRQHALGALLADHVIVEDIADLLRGRHAAVLLGHQRRLRLLTDDVVA